MTRDEARRLRRSWRRDGLPGFAATPPVLSVPAPRPPPCAEDMERLVRLSDLPEDVREYRPEVER
jgi:hypothetical protein